MEVFMNLREKIIAGLEEGLETISEKTVEKISYCGNETDNRKNEK